MFRVMLLFICLSVFCPVATAKRKIFIPGVRAIVIDERLSALRAKPRLKAPIEQRLRRGRLIGILGPAIKNGEARYLQVAISRNVRGWILADAIARPGNLKDAEKLMTQLETVSDEFSKARAARMLADQFRSTKFAPRALMILGEAAERAAEKLTRDARRRIGEDQSLNRRVLFLNFSGLDRYNRIGITFDYDEEENRLIYDGAAYRELVRRYPRSAEAINLQAKG